MAGTGFGFQPYPQRRSVSAQAVGQALAQRAAAAQQQSPMQAEDELGGGMFADEAMPMDGYDDPLMELDGADGGDEYEDSAVQIARREAKSRIAGGLMRGQQQQPAAMWNDAQLSRMGISEAEKRLMRLSGGIK